MSFGPTEYATSSDPIIKAAYEAGLIEGERRCLEQMETMAKSFSDSFRPGSGVIKFWGD